MPDENKEEPIEQDIPEMHLDNKYSSNKDLMPESPEKMKKELDKTKKEIDKLKAFILKKYSFTQVISILPPASIKHFVEEEEVPKETEKHIHLLVVIPEDKIKDGIKIKEEIVKQIEELKQKIWLHIKTPTDLWELCLDSKFELVTAIAMSYPLHDTGVLGALRVAEIHKSLVLQKFEKYVVSYVIAGSLVRGEAIPTSDVDVFIIINDTDVKRMPRLELKERLRSIIYQYVAEASSIAGVKNKLSPQIYLLTDFWESVKDAHPVIFTFIRDGIPIYDRGTFMPWKSLLRMGKLKPSPEAIDMFMSMGDKTVKRVKTGLLEMVVNEIFWGITTPSQALLMLYGLPPPTPKHVAGDMKRIFVDKEKMLEKRYVNILEKVINIYKDYEHEKIKELSGAEIDKLVKDTEDYLKRLKDLREQIEKRAQEKTIEQIYKDVFSLLKSMLGNKSQDAIIEEFETKFVKKAKFTPQNLRILKDIVHARAEFKKGKSDAHKVDQARKNASILINDIIEYNQRCDLFNKKNEKK
ncbi:nucleotidyltransferase domain-containing protein [Candidatus Pacearchaeota archaeon]|nr:nucleotidyltransferase domain-containing protein [Candidatus Pacearchaeota archaeon]